MEEIKGFIDEWLKMGERRGQSRLEHYIKTHQVKRGEKSWLILGVSQELFVTLGRIKEDRDIPVFISKDVAAGYKS